MTSAVVRDAWEPLVGGKKGADEAEKETYIGSHRLVHWTPPDILLRGVLLHNSLIRG